jgi:DNA-binding IclR family transcriptional regulator
MQHMPRRAPAVERVIAVLNLLAAHPGQPHTLSDIARELGLNKATLHAILWALTQEGYLARDPIAKSYTVGPALIALGNAAMEGFAVVHSAMPEMQALTADLGYDCVASAAINDEIVILARTGAPRPFGINVLPGMRVPLAPPLGTVFVAWSGSEEIDRWLARVGPEAAKNNIERYRQAVEAVRSRGYSVALAPGDENSAARRGIGQSLTEVERVEYALLELDNSASYLLRHIGAPVFGTRGEVVLALFLIGFQNEIPAEEVPRMAAQLQDASARVSQAINGHEPARAGRLSSGAS